MGAAVTEEQIQRARAIQIEHEIGRRGIRLAGKNEQVGPCPRCGGTDRFAINKKEKVWNCRGCGKGGDVIELVRFLEGCDFAAAVEKLTGEPARTNGAHPPASRKIAATYDYVDQDGGLLFQVVRFDPKDFRQRRPDGAGGWEWSVKGVRQVPYRLPDLQEAMANERTVVIVEGEKDADALARWGIPATCNAGGAGKFRAEICGHFKRADVVIIVDADAPGRAHAFDVSGKLDDLCNSVRILELPAKDASDWIAAGGTADEFWRLVETEAKSRNEYKAAIGDAFVSAEAEAAPRPDVLPFDTFDAGTWEGVSIEPRRWIVCNRIPAGEPGIMSGDGGTGKTKLLLQLASAVAGEWPDWAGGVVEAHGPVIFYSAEERLTEMHRRVADILAHRGLSFSDLKGQLRFLCDLEDVTLAKADHNGNVTPTLSLLRLEKTVELLKPMLVVIENAADVFAGNENDRGAVTRFVRKELGKLTKPSDAAVALIQHPSVSGLNDGTGRSGSTGWNNSGRWRLNFVIVKNDETDTGLRQLEVVKSNYGPIGETVRLRWDRGVFVPEGSTSSVERGAAESNVDDAFLRCLRIKSAQGITLSPYTGKNYAPAILAKMSEANGYKSKAFEAALERQLSSGHIVAKQVGPASRSKTILVFE